MRVSEALERYERRAGPKRRAIVERYLKWGGTNEDRDLTRWVRSLQEAGYKPGTIDLYVRTVRAFWRSLGLEPPRASGWRYDPHDATRPALSPSLVERMVQAALREEISPQQSEWLALASVYGMRAQEMASIRDGDVDPEGGRIYVRTAKGGRPRWCWLPPEIRPWVSAERRPTTVERVERAFVRVWAAVSDAPRPERVGWHAIRRALVRGLAEAGVPERDVIRFLRWARAEESSASRMAALYAAPSHEVSESGAEVARVEDEGRREADAAVWERHPFLPYWRA